ncbi:MAG: PP2C family protein-serine/threonine phosphatase [Tepidisphaeraceae bacterium]|jgi:sigma-B regulation protein RsbU (phosphoserine phosphatase)
MKLLEPTQNAHLTALAEMLDALAVSSDPCQFLPTLLARRDSDAAGRAYLEVVTEGCHFPCFKIKRLVVPNRSSPTHITGHLCEGGIVPELTRVPLPKAAQDLNLLGDPGLPPVLRRYQSLLAVPIHTGPGIFDWVIVFDPRPDGFTPDDIEETLLRTRLVSMTVDSLRISQQLCSANLRIARELEEIADIQRTLLPETLPAIPGLELAVSYDPVTNAGGDFYDLIPLGRRPGHPECEGDQRWAILIGDVSGHGPAAAVVMAMLHAIVYAYPHSPTDPAHVLAYANRHLWNKRMKGAFVTALLAFYDPASRKLIYCRAGHPPAILTTWGNPPLHRHLDDVGNLPLGVDPDLALSCGEIRLEPGQTMTLYTDGIIEAQNEADKFLDISGMEMAIANGEGNASRIVSSILATLEWHTRERPAGDDRTVLVLKSV